MELIELDQDNLEYYEDYMEPDAAENIGRECCTGLVLMDGYEGETVAALLWEKKTLGADEESYAELSFFRSEDRENGQEILNAYSDKASREIERSWFEFEDLSGEQRAIFEEAGFVLKEAESRDLHLTVEDLCKLKLGAKKLPHYVKSIKSLSSKQFWQGIANALFCEKKGLLEDLDYNSDFLSVMTKIASEKNYPGGSAIIFKSAGGSKVLPKLLESFRPDDTILLRLEEDTFMVLSSTKWEKAVYLMQRRINEAYAEETGGMGLESGYVLREPKESIGDFAKRVEGLLR
ncbi:MAG: hypothetical protein J6O55_07110 [Lachnospiraceae bacterium]|nr:hypothetical protein [Lachnospiraceae bacterium]